MDPLKEEPDEPYCTDWKNHITKGSKCIKVKSRTRASMYAKTEFDKQDYCNLVHQTPNIEFNA